MALTALVGLAVPTMTGGAVANADASLRDEEYWFHGWAIDEVWPTSRGAGVTVAVLDTGVSADIPDLSGAVIPGGDVTDNGTDGRTDLGSGLGHGTAMAALIAGQGQDKIMGVAPDAKILPVVVNTGFEDPEQTYTDGIRFAVDNGADVINLSQAADGSGEPNNCPTQVQDAVKYAVDNDVVVVAGAGNDGDTINAPQYPAACAGVVSVGAIDHNGDPWVSTQDQPYVDVAGFGVGIVSVGANGDGVDSDGTSNSSALVSAVVALIRGAHPDMPARQVVARLLASVHDVGPEGKDNLTGAGIVGPVTAVTATDIPADAPNPIFDELDALPASGGDGSAAPSDQASGVPAADSSDSGGSSALPIVVAVVVVVVLALIVLVLVGRSRRRNRRVPFGPPGQWPPR